MSIRQKLFLFVLFGSIIPLVLVFIISFTQQKNQLRESIETSLSTQAIQSIKAIHDRVLDARFSLHNFSELGVMQRVATNDSLDLLKKDIERFAEAHPIFAKITALNASGRVIATTDPTMLNKNIANFKKFRIAKEGEIYLSLPEYSIKTGFYVSVQSYPILGPTGQVIGVLIGELNWLFLDSYLTDDTVLGKSQSANNFISLRSSRNGVQLYQSDGANIPLSVTKKSKVNTLEDVVKDGVEYISLVVAPEDSHLYSESSLLLHLFVDKESAFSSINNLTRTYATIGFFALMLVGLMWWFISKSIGDRITNLTQGVRQISKGNYEHPLPQSNNLDEIGELTQSFNLMRRTIRYNETKLIEKTQSAEQAAKLKGEFLANMSHEVRTPINGVLGMAELMLQTDMSVDQKRYASTIHRSGQSLLSVINDILDFSKIEAGKLDITKAPFDLRETVEDVVEMLAETAHRKGLELNVEIHPEEHIAFNGDAGRIRQILVNLINNAIKFTSSGEVKVTISSIVKNKIHTGVRFDVSDTGIGIPTDKQDRVFREFEQADGTTTREYGGTGLGLAISKKLVTLMNGDIGFTSNVNEGSNFWFTVQLEPLSEKFQDRWSSSDTLKDRYILIVDDHQTNREILHEQLAHWGAQTIMANGPEHALQLIEDCHNQNRIIDVAIVDQQMPKMSGIDLIQEIKDTWPNNKMAFVVLSSVNENRAEESARDLAKHSHITKPARQKDLYNCLAAVLSDDSDAITADIELRELKDSALTGEVLVVEDNPVNQEMMIEMLSIMGMKVELAENGEEAVTRLGQKSFDLIFMDCQMPVMDGFKATSVIRENEALGKEKTINVIVALTANALEGDRERCLASGMDDYLSKPVSTAELRQCLVKWLPAKESPSPETLTDKTVISASNVQNLPTIDKELESENIESLASKDLPVIKQVVFQDLMKMCEQASEGFFDKLVSKYIEGSNEDLTTLQSAIINSDAELVRTSAHRLKSSSANLAGERVAELCQRLESAGRENDLSDAEALLKSLEVEVDELISQLSEHRRAA